MFEKMIRYALLAASLVSALMFVVEITDPVEASQQAAGQSIARAVFCGCIAGFMFYQRHRKSSPISLHSIVEISVLMHPTESMGSEEAPQVGSSPLPVSEQLNSVSVPSVDSPIGASENPKGSEPTATQPVADASDSDAGEQVGYAYNTSDYGPATMAPSPESESIRGLMVPEDRQRFDSDLQSWQETASGLIFHPEVRACMWGRSLANLAEFYREKELRERALRYMNAAWRVSQYPLFANDAALLALSIGETARARSLLKSFLSDYQRSLQDRYKMIEPGLSADRLGQIISSARQQLLAIEVKETDCQDGVRESLTPNDAAEILANSIGDAFSESRFIEHFGDRSFSEQWTVRDALAVWYSFGLVSLDVTVWTSVGSPKQANLLLESCDSLLSKKWKMSHEMLTRLNETRGKNSKQAFLAFVDCKSGEDYQIYFFRCVNWIFGAELPFGDKSKTIELIEKGHQPKILDPFATAAYCRYFVDMTTETKRTLRAMKIVWPAATG